MSVSEFSSSESQPDKMGDLTNLVSQIDQTTGEFEIAVTNFLKKPVEIQHVYMISSQLLLNIRATLGFVLNSEDYSVLDKAAIIVTY